MKGGERLFVGKQEVLEKWFPASEATLYRAIRKGAFPGPKKITERVRAWLLEDLEHWAAQQRAEGRPCSDEKDSQIA